MEVKSKHSLRLRGFSRVLCFFSEARVEARNGEKEEFPEIRMMFIRNI